MAISINWATKVIYVPQSFLTFLSGDRWQLDINAFRLALKDIEDSEEGSVFPDTHRHNTTVTLSGVTYTRTFEIINGYTVEFETKAQHYTVVCIGANHNIGDVLVPGAAHLVIGNSAGLVTGLDALVESNYNVIQALRLVLSSVAGKLSGAAGPTVSIRNVGDTKTRITATVDSSGNRTAVTYDVS